MQENQILLFEEKKKKKKIVISIDKVYIFSIIFLTALIGSFCLGVEKGKKLKTVKTQNSGITVETKREEKLPRIEESPKIKEAKEEEKNIYSIQLATYAKKEIAEREAEKLKRKGFKPIIIKKGKFLVLCVGKFRNKNEARKLLVQFKKSYSDCFLRKL